MRLLSSILLITLYFHCFSQNREKEISIASQIKLNHIQKYRNFDYPEPNSKLGYEFATNINYYLNQHFKIGQSLAFSTMREVYNITLNDPTGKTIANGYEVFKHQYLILDGTLRFYPDKILSGFIALGPYGGFLLTYENKFQGDYNGSWTSNGSKNDYRFFDYGISGSVGYESMPYRQLLIGGLIQYRYSLTNQFINSPGKEVKLRNLSFGLSVGFLL